MFKLDLEKAEEPEIKMPTFTEYQITDHASYNLLLFIELHTIPSNGNLKD